MPTKVDPPSSPTQGDPALTSSSTMTVAKAAAATASAMTGEDNESWTCICGITWPGKRKRCSCKKWKNGRNLRKASSSAAAAGAAAKSPEARTDGNDDDVATIGKKRALELLAVAEKEVEAKAPDATAAVAVAVAAASNSLSRGSDGFPESSAAKGTEKSTVIGPSSAQKKRELDQKKKKAGQNNEKEQIRERMAKKQKAPNNNNDDNGVDKRALEQPAVAEDSGCGSPLSGSALPTTSSGQEEDGSTNGGTTKSAAETSHEDDMQQQLIASFLAGRGDVNVNVNGDSKEPPQTPKSKTNKHNNTKEKKSTNKPKKDKKDESTTLTNAEEFTWICAECHEAECFDNPDAPLLLCDGRCNRPFHSSLSCANLTTLPPEDEPWHCADCLKKRHQCVVCKEYGEDDVDVFCCEAKGCGLFFHENCLSMYDAVNVQIVEEVVPVLDADGTTDLTKVVSRPKFRCPAHKCWTCDSDIPCLKTICESGGSVVTGAGEEGAAGVGTQVKRGKKKRKSNAAASAMWGAKKERLFRCLDCPISYHITCMPPSCRFHELAMLCHEHSYTSKLPRLDDSYSFQMEVEADAEKQIEKMKRGMNRAAAANGEKGALSEEEASDGVEEGQLEQGDNPFLPGVVGSFALFEEDQLVEYLGKDSEDPESGKKRRKNNMFHYCLPCDLKDEVHSKPPSYTHVNANRYDPDNRPKRHPPTVERCHCKPTSEEGGISCGDRCLNRLSYVECHGDNCNVGPTCGNRAMSKRQFAKCRPMREHGKGWGLVAIDGVKRGDLVQEYAGEIIDEKTKEERLKAWAVDHPNDPNFYVMHLEPGWYVDARERANMARFINHSCAPNCRLVPVNVGGHMRVAIMAICDVGPGEFLSYDYQFDTRHGDKFICRCGAKDCRGTMKGGKAEDDKSSPKKTKKQLLLEAKARIQRDKKFLQSVSESEKDRLYLTDAFVPGEDVEKTEMVAGGPKERYRREVQEQHIFLWRNATAGCDFSSRERKIFLRKSGRKVPNQPLASLCCRMGPLDVISMIE